MYLGYLIDSRNCKKIQELLATAETKECNVMIDGRNIFDDISIYANIRKVATDQGDDYTAGCLF